VTAGRGGFVIKHQAEPFITTEIAGIVLLSQLGGPPAARGLHV
jgi:hypothetical protein